MSKKGVLCKFYLHRACLKGEHCEFSHDSKDPPNNICTFYQKGACAYGKHCRYDHVKISRSQPSASSSSSRTYPSEYIISESTSVGRPFGDPLGGLGYISGVNSEVSATSRSLFPIEKPAWANNSEDNVVSEFSGIGESRSHNLADHPICSFAAAGNCPRGETCPHIHGDLCPTCGKHCLHPFRPHEIEEHLKTCVQRQKHLESLKQSQEIECSVCLERVLSKPTVSERKFGILSECDHPFCISCIRNWRNSSPSSGNSTLRACPICRKLSYFVIPSVIWYYTKEEKQEIVDSYKEKLRSIDCRHFDFGNGTCPFGTSCFYKHTVKPGSYQSNATLMPHSYSSSLSDVPHSYSSSLSDVDEAGYSSEEGNIDEQLEICDQFYRPHDPVGVEEDYSYEDLDDETLAFLLMLETLNMSDSNDEDIDGP